MSVAIFSYGYKPEKFLINELAEYLSINKNVVVSTGLPNYPCGSLFENYSIFGPYFERENSIQIYRFPIIPRKKGFLFLSLNYLTNLIFGIVNIFRLPKTNCAFVFATSPIMTAIQAIFYSKLHKVPVIIWLQDLWPESFNAIVGKSSNSLVSRLIGKMVKWIYKHSDCILIQSPSFNKNLLEYGFEGRVEWVPNWANNSNQNKKIDWLPENTEKNFIITFAGNIGIAQDIDNLLEAAKILQSHKNIVFYIVGDGREKERLETKYKELKNVIFFGSKPPEDMQELFNKSSALLVSLKKDPVFSLVIPSKMQTYMKARKPIITVLDGAGANIAKQYKLGPIVEPGKSKVLAREILDLSKAKKIELEKYGNNAYALYEEHFQQEIVFKKIEKVLKEVCK